jgi:lysophospholipase L1-like esterase
MKKTFFVFLCTFLILASLEGGFRVLELVRPPQVHSSPAERPSQLGVLSKKKPKSELRIFVYGGSVAWGEPLQEVGLGEQLQFLLKDRFKSKTIHVINLASPGANSTNILSTIHESIDWLPDAIIVLPIHNEFLAPPPPFGSQLRLKLASIAEKHLAIFRILKHIRYLQDNKATEDSALGKNLYVFDQSSPEFEKRVAQYEDNVESMIDLAKSRKIPIILGTGPSNVRDWPPVEEALWPPFVQMRRNKEFRALIHEIVKYFDKSPEHSENLIERGLQQYPQNALLHFWHGRTEAAMGNFTRAYDDFLFAKEMDPMPWRHLSKLNDVLKSKSTEPGVYVADLVDVLESAASHRLVGFDLMVDNCHPTPWGYYLMATEILNKLVDAGVINGSFTVDRDTFNKFIDMSGFRDPKSGLELRYFLYNALYVQKVPFFNFSAARRYLHRARELDPTNPQVWANLAAISFLENDTSRGQTELERAFSFSKQPIAPFDRAFAPYLQEALEFAQHHAHARLDLPLEAVPPDAERRDGLWP